MRISLPATTASIATGAIMIALVTQWLSPGNAQQAKPRYLPEYNAAGELLLPKNFHDWVYVGSPLTPIPLNGGKKCPEPEDPNAGPCTNFPEYHNVYIEPGSYEIYKQTKQFPEGTIIFKELQLLSPAQFPDGSRTEPSGRGFFGAKFNGADVTVKDTKRFAASGGWGYFNFNHHEPKAPAAKATNCGFSCHRGGAKKDDVWIQYYQLLDN